MNFKFCLIAFILTINLSLAQQNNNKPKLVVGIVVDQMRYEYLIRYSDNYGEDGFKRLMREGFNNKNTHFNYIPTKTAPGHASIYTGATPKVHGIIANSWYDRNLKRNIENVEDTVSGEFNSINMLASTITDELKLSTQRRSKVISISLKNRGAILPGGHAPDGAYWFDDSTGDFTTSSYYGQKANWVNEFNQSRIADSLLNLTWETLLPIESYTSSMADTSSFERIFKGKETSTFPYHLSELRKHNKEFKLLPTTPYGNTILTMLAKRAIIEEKLGQGDETDMLAISYSSTDKVGHDFGPQSVEVEDVYLRLDKELGELLSLLDQSVGEGEYLLFLTADHAVAETADQMKAVTSIPAGLIQEPEMMENINTHLYQKYGKKGWVSAIVNEQIYFDRKAILDEGLKLEDIQQDVANFVGEIDGVATTYPAYVFKWQSFSVGVERLLQMGYHPKRSGDVLLVYEPGWMVRDSKGTTHGSGYSYDTHVPLLWFGKSINPGYSLKRQEITDIAPTLSFLLGIKLPNGSIGDPIEELF